MQLHPPELTGNGEFPDITRPGHLIFGAVCDGNKLHSIFHNGIKKRGGIPMNYSYFSDVVSLTPISFNGYAETTINWTILHLTALRSFGIMSDRKNLFDYAFILDPDFVKEHLEDFTAVGEFLHMNQGKGILVGALQGMKIGVTSPIYHDKAEATEVHYTGDNLPVSAIKGVVIDGDDNKFDKAKAKLIEVLKSRKELGSNFNLPIGIYNKKGILIERFD